MVENSRIVLLEDKTNEKTLINSTKALLVEEPKLEPDLGLSYKSDRLKAINYYV